MSKPESAINTIFFPVMVHEGGGPSRELAFKTLNRMVEVANFTFLCHLCVCGPVVLVTVLVFLTNLTL